MCLLERFDAAWMVWFQGFDARNSRNLYNRAPWNSQNDSESISGDWDTH